MADKCTLTPAARWYALQVYTGREKWVTSCLQDIGYETLLLVSAVISQWSDRRKKIDRPVFPGYIFCHFDSCTRASVLAVPGVLYVVGRGKTPVPVEEHEIASLQQIARANYSVQPCPYFETGDWVSIEGGCLDGLIGTLVAFKKGPRVVVSVSLLRRSVCLEVDQERLRPADPQGWPHKGTHRSAASGVTSDMLDLDQLSVVSGKHSGVINAI